uniref:Uncharacterized protein n=1 Tax=Lactuca sativa TaxID=4236 RepID=A0A9R1XGW5_LACSA|nr:hypothetical protein LSAT_V11C400218920 [Lactuca sativa]
MIVCKPSRWSLVSSVMEDSSLVSASHNRRSGDGAGDRRGREVVTTGGRWGTKNNTLKYNRKDFNHIEIEETKIMVVSYVYLGHRQQFSLHMVETVVVDHEKIREHMIKRLEDNAIIGIVSGKAIFGPPVDEYWKKKLEEETAKKENDTASS